MKLKKLLSLLLASSMVVSLAACGGEAAEETGTETSISEIPFTISEDPVVVTTEDEKESEEEVIPENSYRSELTNEWISNDIKDQRPVAVMIDNEEVALPHYGTSQADIIYEMMNSSANNRITRFMAIFKDWQNVEQIGNIRSTRPTNAYLFAEYNAILVHDGGPYFIDEWLAHENSTNHLSGGFARIDRGKAGFYEEYATNETWKGTGEYAGKTYDSLLDRITDAGYDLEYNEYYMGNHFNFSDTEFTLDDEKKVVSAEKVELNFPHNESTLTYDEDTGLYVYSEYGEAYEDALTGDSLTFKNLIIYATPFIDYGEGYMCYNAIGTTKYGYYCTNGKAIPIWWEKEDQDSLTKFYKMSDDSEITLNTGKTYIAICPLDTFESDFVIK